MTLLVLHVKPSLTIDMGSKVNLADIVILKHCLVTSIRCVVSSTVVQRASGRKCQTYRDPSQYMLDQRTVDSLLTDTSIRWTPP